MTKLPLLRILLLPFVFSLIVSLLTRLGLAIYANFPLYQYPLSLVFGLFYDVLFAIFLLAPVLLFFALLPNKLINTKFGVYLYWLIFVVIAFALLFTAVAEFVFWDEFAARFNFIAVDYLVYTNEVVGNIWQSYPVGKILFTIFMLSLLLVYIAWKVIWQKLNYHLNIHQRITAILIAIIMPIAAFFIGGDSQIKDRTSSDVANELAGNGPYQFFSAFRANDLDFMRFYRTLPESQAFAIVDQLRQRQDLTKSSASSATAKISYMVPANPSSKTKKPANVILVSVESLGAEFIGSWGSTKNLTPNLDKLTDKSLVFKRVYATGNRTVRGLEALSIALPPTPGQSIVKRADNDNLFTLGGVLKQANYQPMFIYGGYGYFDNMNAYFENNGYLVKDRLQVAKEKIHFENVWGIADEDLYTFAIEQIDETLQQNKNQAVFAHIMTTSNHRPYTYPEQRIDIPSGSGRDGAVKYTDWALGQLIAQLEKKPWFANTILIITADHGANARGSQDIPVNKYLIPLWIYSPNLIKAQINNRLMSQIDIAPTLMGLLGISYESRFFGQDVLNAHTSANEYAFVANYQALGYLKDGRLITLLPQKQVRVSKLADEISRVAISNTQDDQALINEAIAWYQAAFISFRQKMMKINNSSK